MQLFVIHFANNLIPPTGNKNKTNNKSIFWHCGNNLLYLHINNNVL